MSSTHFTRKEDISRQWLVVDAKDLVVGRLCTNLAMFLMGKHKPTYTPHVDNGDYVKGMLPKNKTLSTRSLMKLKIYTGDKHPHAVQNPKAVKIEGRTGKVTE
jgi:large subunit ribosomal protein L13